MRLISIVRPHKLMVKPHRNLVQYAMEASAFLLERLIFQNFIYKHLSKCLLIKNYESYALP